MTKNTIMKCDACLGLFDTTEHLVKQIDITINGDELMLTYFDCPLCGKRYDVIIDNQETKRVKRDVDSIAKRLQVSARKGRLPTEYQVKKMMNEQVKLKKLYDNLFNHYNMSFYQSGDIKHQLKITIPKVHSEETKGENNNV